MKRNLLLATSLFWIGCFSQSIIIDTNTYTIPELVTNVLVNKSCVLVSNIKSKTGTDFGSSNGIGYFKNTNPSFPLSSGVILSTGDVKNAPGPNTIDLDDGNMAWTGDRDLENTLLAAGIKMKSSNATVLEFDFIPFSPNFDFQFLFASEEYGNFQCQFSDAFAFLLTNTSTGVTTNLAVVPDSTIPISVVTIRNSLYNSSCSSENPNYFGAFNGGSNAAGSATNFNGQTVVMNATSSTLVPNTMYHIKLVIADREDNKADSAIFLVANSFNVGQDVLGPNLTIENNTAICDKGSHIITSGLDPAIYSFAWTFNGTPTGGNTPDLTVTQAGTYSLTYTIIKTNCEVTTDFITIEYYEAIMTPDPVDLFKCDSSLPSFSFDLSYNTPIITIPGTQISYHATSGDAISNSNPLPNNYSVTTSSLPTTIWTRILDKVTGCVTAKTFQLKLAPPPVANNPGDMSLCETKTGTNIANFNLTSQTPSVLSGHSPLIYTVSYHINASDANAGKNPINTSIPFTSGNLTVFARIQNNTDPTCFNTTNFNLIVQPRPILDPIPDQFVCESYTLPVLANPGDYYSGPNRKTPMLFAGDVIDKDTTIYIYYETGGTLNCSSERSFRVKIVLPKDLNPVNVNVCDKYTLPQMPYGVRYFTLPDGPDGNGTEISGGTTKTTPGTTTIFTYFVSTDLINPCILQGKFDITITITPKITPIANVFDCVSYNLPPLTVGDYYTFDSVTQNYTLASTPITTTTKIYVFATNGICRSPDTIFTVYIGSVGIRNIKQCDPYNLQQAPVGEYRDAPAGKGNIIPPGLILESKIVYIYVPEAGTPNCTDNEFFKITIDAPLLASPTNVTQCDSYLLPNQIDGGAYYTLSGGPAKPGNRELIPNVDKIKTTSTIYIYKPSTTLTGCYIEKPWLITINQKPIIDSRANIEQCNYYVLTPLTNGNYFDDPNGINPIPAGTRISSNNRIYIYAAHPNDPFCNSENSFDITINGVKADPIPTQLSYCDSFTFPDLPTPNNFYYDAPGGPWGRGKIIPFGTKVTASNVKPTYYIYYETGNRLNCSDEHPFSLKIAPQPFANPVNPIETCDTFGANDGVFQFDLTTQAIRNQVLNGQTPNTDFTLTYYTSLADANNTNATPVSNPTKYQNDKPFTDSVWIRVANNTIPNPCFAVVELKLIINSLPIIQLMPEYFICEDYKTGTLLNPAILNTGLTASNYIFEWTLDGNPYKEKTPSITVTQIGDYTVKVTNTDTNCINTFTSKVSKYAPYIEITYSDAFENSTFITVNVLGAGSGNYEYKLDEFPFQDSNIFNNVIAGDHIVTVRDKNGHCNPAPINAVIINYPKFFTPNGDGFNETWNILHLQSKNPNAPIFIFDRYGKLVKEISPSSEGWDGMYNGQPLPATDYWFTVDYSEKGIAKIFKSHFSLKR